MGRHSVPDDESAEPVEAAEAAVAVATAANGRHARAEEGEQAAAFEDTAKIARIDVSTDPAAEAVPGAGGGADGAAIATPQEKKRSRARSTAADLALVRGHSDVRARVIAAVLVPFAVYTAAMAAIGKLDRSYLLWIWIPLVTAGILVGLFLDLGHRKYRQ